MVNPEEWSFEAIGTHWSITVPGLTEERAEELVTKALARIAQFDQTYSRFRSDSFVTKMSQSAGTYELPSDAHLLLNLYRHLYEVTEGKVTPLIGQVLSDAGYDAEYSLKPQILTASPSWDEVLYYSYPTLTLSQPALLDFGAAGKGYLVDLIAEQFLSDGVTSFSINAGGDIRYESLEKTVLHVGLEHPKDPTQVLGIAALTTGSICGSAGNRRAWGEFHHIIDPVTLSSPTHLQAVWVTAPTALVADALTTCLFFIEPSALKKRIAEKYAFEYLIVRQDGTYDRSAAFEAEIFRA